MSNNNNHDSYSDSLDWDGMCGVAVLFGSSEKENIVRDCDFTRQIEENKYLKHSQLKQSEFNLEYNSIDKWLLEQAQVEIKHIIQSIHLKLHETDNSQHITPVKSFVASLPYHLLKNFST